MNFRKVKADFDGSMWVPLGDTPIPEYTITDDAISGFIVQRFEQFDADPPITGAHKLFGQLTYGNQHPDLILSSEKMMKRMVSCIIPDQRDPMMYGCNFGFRFNNAIWSHPENLSFEIPDGWVFMLNRTFPENPRLNGCMKAAWMEATNGDIMAMLEQREKEYMQWLEDRVEKPNLEPLQWMKSRPRTYGELAEPLSQDEINRRIAAVNLARMEKNGN